MRRMDNKTNTDPSGRLSVRNCEFASMRTSSSAACATHVALRREDPCASCSGSECSPKQPKQRCIQPGSVKARHRNATAQWLYREHARLGIPLRTHCVLENPVPACAGVFAVSAQRKDGACEVRCNCRNPLYGVLSCCLRRHAKPHRLHHLVTRQKRCHDVAVSRGAACAHAAARIAAAACNCAVAHTPGQLEAQAVCAGSRCHGAACVDSGERNGVVHRRRDGHNASETSTLRARRVLRLEGAAARCWRRRGVHPVVGLRASAGQRVSQANATGNTKRT